MADENLFKFATQDFGAFKSNYSSFLKGYTSSLSEMMKMNSTFLKEKSEEIEKLIQINNVIFTGSGGASQEGEEGSGEGDGQVNGFMKVSSQTAERVNEQFKNADEMLKKATQQLEELSNKSNEILKKMHPEFNMTPAPETPEPQPEGIAPGE